ELHLVSAGSLDGTSIGLCFSAPITASSATNPSNYSLSSGGPITSATLRPDSRTVALRLQSPAGSPFSVTATGIVDSGAGHVGGGTVVGRVEGLFGTNLGAPAIAGSTFVCREGAIEVTAGGRDIWDNADEGYFVHTLQTGDFDMKVRASFPA